MEDFTFYSPTKIIFGRGKIEKIGEELRNEKVKKVLMVYGIGSIKRNGAYEKIISSLKDSNVNFVEFPGVKPNPMLKKVREGITLARKERCDGILAVGGGSVIDTAKAIAAGVPYNGDVWDFYNGKSPETSLSVYTILTISGTGSEMNGNSVITNERTLEKKPMYSPFVQPKISIIDPEIQKSVPIKMSVYDAIDAMTHVFEYYFNGVKNLRFGDLLCESLIRTIMDSIEILINNPEDYDARAELAWCSTMALNGMTSVGRGRGDWASHRIEHALSALYDIPHGAGLAIIFPAWLEYTMDVNNDKIIQLGERVFQIKDEPIEIIEKLRNWYRKMGAPVYLEDADIPPEDIEKIAANGSITYPLGCAKTLNKEDVVEILKIASRRR